MLCKNPFRIGVMEYGCGQCMPCRINRRRSWVARMLLESQSHQAACFITLTYNEENVPNDQSVHKAELQKFFKRLRKNFAGTIRYFACGEYGEKSNRPHYHAIVYGLDPSIGDALVPLCWKKGFVQVGVATPESMAYCASYVVKKWTKKGHPDLKGRDPEFVLMSRNPGLGYNYVQKLAEAYHTERGEIALERLGWIGSEIRICGKTYQMPRYLKEKLAVELDLSPEKRKTWLQGLVKKRSEEVAAMTATEMEERRKAKIQQQAGRLLRKRKRTI